MVYTTEESLTKWNCEFFPTTNLPQQPTRRNVPDFTDFLNNIPN